MIVCTCYINSQYYLEHIDSVNTYRYTNSYKNEFVTKIAIHKLLTRLLVIFFFTKEIVYLSFFLYIVSDTIFPYQAVCYHIVSVVVQHGESHLTQVNGKSFSAIFDHMDSVYTKCTC
jgi:hypothetical protein